MITFAKLLKCLELIRGDSKCGTTDETSMTGYHGNRSQHLTDKSSWSFASKRYDVEPCNGWVCYTQSYISLTSESLITWLRSHVFNDRKIVVCLMIWIHLSG